MEVIIVTGTPCTGKTTYAKEFARKKGYEYVDVSALIKEKKLSESYDEEKQCDVVDTEKLNKVLIEIVKKADDENKAGLVIDSHMSHYLSSEYVDLCIVTKCELKELKQRLSGRKYSKEKIEENLQAEIFDICYIEAEENGHNVKVVDTSSA